MTTLPKKNLEEILSIIEAGNVQGTTQGGRNGRKQVLGEISTREGSR